MIDTTFQTTFPSSSTRPATAATPGGFTDALNAATRAARQQEEHRSDLAAIREKGFSDWARDIQIEKLKEELRQRVMAAMGLDENQLSRLNDAMRQILEQKIEDEVERTLQEILATATEQPGSVAAAAYKPTGNQDTPGKKCPVIPALIWPGGASVL